MPGSIAVILAVGVASGVLERFGLSRMEVSTVCVLLTCLVGFSLIVRISLPLNALRSALLVVVVGIIAFGCTVAGRFFEISPLAPTMLVSIAIIGAVALIIFNLLFNRGVELARGDEGYESFMRTIENHKERRDDHGSDQPC